MEVGTHPYQQSPDGTQRDMPGWSEGTHPASCQAYYWLIMAARSGRITGLSA